MDSDNELRFGELKSAFAEFKDAIIEGDKDRAFVRYQKFKVLSAMILDSLESDGVTSHFREESGRIQCFLEYELGFRSNRGYCSDFDGAEFILGEDLATRYRYEESRGFH